MNKLNKLQITTAIIMFFVFAGIFFATQHDSLFNGAKSSTIPTLPPDNLFTTPNQQQLQDPNQKSDVQAQQEAQARAQAQAQGQTRQQMVQQQPQQQAVVPTMGVEEPTPASATAHIETTKGTIDLKLFPDKAPNTVKNFIAKVKSGFYQNLIFHRVEGWVIQGGDPKGDGTGGGKMTTELNDVSFVAGSLGVARGGDIQVSNDSQFFITKTDSTHLNNQYTNFGMVTGGMDVVKKVAIGDHILKITIDTN